MIVREAIVTLLQRGTPVVGAIVGGLECQRRRGKLAWVVGGAAGGYLGGWLAQRFFFDAVENLSAQALPTKEASVGALPAPKPPKTPKTPPPSGDEGFKPPIARNGTKVEYLTDSDLG
jgi:hypothetical protein